MSLFGPVSPPRGGLCAVDRTTVYRRKATTPRGDNERHFDFALSTNEFRDFTKVFLWKSFEFYPRCSEYKEVQEIVKFQGKSSGPTLPIFSYPMKSKNQPFIRHRSNFYFRAVAADFRFLPSARPSVASSYRETLTLGSPSLAGLVRDLGGGVVHVEAADRAPHGT